MSNEKEEKQIEQEKAQQAIKDAVKNYVHDKVVEGSEAKEEESVILEEMLKEANMPVELTDEEFKCGPQELDIRKLNKRNQAQLLFRIQALNAVYLRNCSKSLLDITNLLFVLLDHLGVTDIIHVSDEVLDKIAEENERLKNEKTNKKPN